MMRHRKAPPYAAHALAVLAAAVLALPVSAQTPPNVLPSQRATAQQVAQAGVPLSELAKDAPDSYTVKSGDTLWDISKKFLTSPWRWPELWGMNLQDIKNPHRIYPGQVLVLEKVDGRARLRMQAQGDAPPTETVRVSPRVRYTALGDTSIPMINPGLIEPFLAEPVVVGEGDLQKAPRLVGSADERVLLTRGDRVYARSSGGAAIAETPGKVDEFRVFRNAVPLVDPYTRKVLGYEAQYLGQAQLLRGEGVETAGEKSTPIPATLELTNARSEMRAGDRLLPEPGRQLVSYAPRAPEQRIDGAIVSIYGDAVGLAGHNQVVVINKGTADGVASGHVLAIMKTGQTIVDKSQPGERSQLKLPDERNGLLMVFRPFEHVSYALVLETPLGVKVGDRLVNPR
ncbi:LysM peptidoglycan-binding domain-containing protein [Ramlibacter algicola]|uniref:LysM peptidoglycan-binding domain-containing protein n=1 Tax=Ramlibacter algicola TaxID=2795217 RepID=A0A934UQ70_9BURK|nr:LysM domain-containing protein [Ramlibacter algicola]MBK0391237.1 LysM peptidoglycan-binding domain-containing protein [Ramlibacter algicola]